MHLAIKFHLFVQKMKNVRDIIVSQKDVEMITNAHITGKYAQMDNVLTDVQF